jgi:hypothetical protein
VSVNEVAAITLSQPGVMALAGPATPIGMAHSPTYFLAPASLVAHWQPADERTLHVAE